MPNVHDEEAGEDKPIPPKKHRLIPELGRPQPKRTEAEQERAEALVEALSGNSLKDLAAHCTVVLEAAIADAKEKQQAVEILYLMKQPYPLAQRKVRQLPRGRESIRPQNLTEQTPSDFNSLRRIENRPASRTPELAPPADLEDV